MPYMDTDDFYKHFWKLQADFLTAKYSLQEIDENGKPVITLELGAGLMTHSKVWNAEHAEFEDITDKRGDL